MRTICVNGTEFIFIGYNKKKENKKKETLFKVLSLSLLHNHR
jgi:hypothetical protein